MMPARAILLSVRCQFALFLSCLSFQSFSQAEEPTRSAPVANQADAAVLTYPHVGARIENLGLIPDGVVPATLTITNDKDEPIRVSFVQVYLCWIDQPTAKHMVGLTIEPGQQRDWPVWIDPYKGIRASDTIYLGFAYPNKTGMSSAKRFKWVLNRNIVYEPRYVHLHPTEIAENKLTGTMTIHYKGPQDWKITAVEAIDPFLTAKFEEVRRVQDEQGVWDVLYSLSVSSENGNVPDPYVGHFKLKVVNDSDFETIPIVVSRQLIGVAERRARK